MNRTPPLRNLHLATAIATLALFGCADTAGPQRPDSTTSGVATGADGKTPTQPGGALGGPGAPGTAPTGGGGVAAPGSIDLSGDPKYFRVVRLTNPQWAASVQQILELPKP
ncbi:MAG TPA: hypothetical protein VFZ61_17390, partial [Polyangiales bacterium]